MSTPFDINQLFGDDSDEGVEPVAETEVSTETPEEAPKEPVKKETPKPEPVVEEEEEDEEEEESSGGEQSVSSVSSLLVEAGILSEDPGEVDKETLLDLIEQETESYVKEALTATFDTWKDKLPPSVMGLIQHSFNGGDPDEYMKTWNETPLQMFNIKEENGQESFLRYYYATVEEMTADEIEEKMDYHLDRGNMEKVAQRYYTKLADDRDKKLQQIAKRQIEAKAKAEQDAANNRKKLLASMDKVDEFAGYKFPVGEKKVLQRYATQPVIEDGRTFSSGLAADLYDALKDPAKVLFLSKLVKNNFDTSFIKEKGKTEAIKKVKKVLQEPVVGIADDVIWD